MFKQRQLSIYNLCSTWFYLAVHQVSPPYHNYMVAEGGYDPPTSGLWAQQAYSAPLYMVAVPLRSRGRNQGIKEQKIQDTAGEYIF